MTRSPGTADDPLRVVVVGSGPAGMYTAAALLDLEGVSVRVDIVERLPAPFGLVRYGVAPDHQKIKGVSRVFDRTLRDERVRYFGNVELGVDLSRSDLQGCYHQVVYAVGAQGDRRLGIAGEDFKGSWSSTEFVNWYNGHPDQSEANYPLDCEAIAVVGIGNVAMDVARILVTAPEELAKTDISGRALETLAASRVRTVHLLSRRGPVQAKCSPPELKELGELSTARVVVAPQDLVLDPASEAALEVDRAARKNLGLLQGFSQAGPASDEGRAKVVLHFLTSPVELIGEQGSVRAVRCERNELVDEGGYLNARGTGSFQELPVQRVIRAIGYRSNPLLDLPYNQRRGIVPNRAGRITDGDDSLRGEYVVGWVKRGPSGLIGSNKADAKATVESMVADLGQGMHLAPAGPVDDRLAQRGVRSVTYAEWLEIAAEEDRRGAESDRPRQKFLTAEEMLAFLE